MGDLCRPVEQHEIKVPRLWSRGRFGSAVTAADAQARVEADTSAGAGQTGSVAREPQIPVSGAIDIRCLLTVFVCGFGGWGSEGVGSEVAADTGLWSDRHQVSPYCVGVWFRECRGLLTAPEVLGMAFMWLSF